MYEKKFIDLRNDLRKNAGRYLKDDPAFGLEQGYSRSETLSMFDNPFFEVKKNANSFLGNDSVLVSPYLSEVNSYFAKKYRKDIESIIKSLAKHESFSVVKKQWKVEGDKVLLDWFLELAVNPSYRSSLADTLVPYRRITQQDYDIINKFVESCKSALTYSSHKKFINYLEENKNSFVPKIYSEVYSVDIVVDYLISNIVKVKKLLGFVF